MGLIGSFIVLSALLMGATQGNDYVVGDSLGWRLPPYECYYSDWASTKTFIVGDTLGKLTLPPLLFPKFPFLNLCMYHVAWPKLFVPALILQ